METSEASMIEGSADLMSGYAFNIGPEGYDPLEVQLALCEWAGYAEDLKGQLAAVQAELEQSRSENRTIRKQVYAGFGVKVATVLRAAKEEGERVLLGDQGQGQACLSAARKEAGEILVAARREAARIRVEAEREGNLRVAPATRTAVRVPRGADVPRHRPPSVRTENGAQRSGPPAPEPIDTRWIDELWAGAS
jgi:hypothetical protein